MTISRSVSVALIASMLLAALPKTSWANEEVTPTAPVDLRAAIDRAAQSVMASNAYVSTLTPAPRPAARARQGGGGGGASMLIWTLVGTAASLGATYYLVKEMRKQTDEAAKQQ
jgi:hypothetical protein